jgi:hypothetical protein
VLLPVMPPTEQFEILELSAAAPRPGHDVVRFALFGWCMAARSGASAIAHDERSPQCRRDRPRRPTDVEHFRPAGSDDSTDVAVARDALEHCCGEATIAAFSADLSDQVRSAAGKLLEVDDNGDVWAHRTMVAERTRVE